MSKTHCHGSPSEMFQADCGDVGPHDEHEIPTTETGKRELTCIGSPAAFLEADCGDVGPHDKHPYEK